MNEITINGWVTRDSSGELYLHSSIPHKKEYTWASNDNWAFTHEEIMLNELDFPQVKWEDNEPTPVTITIQIK